MFRWVDVDVELEGEVLEVEVERLVEMDVELEVVEEGGE